MGRKDRGRRTAYRAAVVFLAVCAACLLAGTVNQRRKEGIGKQALGQMEEAMISFWCPALSFAAGPSEGGILERLFGQFPVLQFFCKQSEPGLLQESPWTYEEIVRAEGQDDDTVTLPDDKLDSGLLIDLAAAELLIDPFSGVLADDIAVVVLVKGKSVVSVFLILCGRADNNSLFLGAFHNVVCGRLVNGGKRDGVHTGIDKVLYVVYLVFQDVLAVGYARMCSFESLSPDRLVQRTKFANGVSVTVNFAEKEFRLESGRILPPMRELIEYQK